MPSPAEETRPIPVMTHRAWTPRPPVTVGAVIMGQRRSGEQTDPSGLCAHLLVEAGRERHGLEPKLRVADRLPSTEIFAFVTA